MDDPAALQQIRDMQESISTLRSEATKAVESVLSDFHPALAIELEDKLTARIAELIALRSALVAVKTSVRARSLSGRLA